MVDILKRWATWTTVNSYKKRVCEDGRKLAVVAVLIFLDTRTETKHCLLFLLLSLFSIQFCSLKASIMFSIKLFE